MRIADYQLIIGGTLCYHFCPYRFYGSLQARALPYLVLAMDADEGVFKVPKASTPLRDHSLEFAAINVSAISPYLNAGAKRLISNSSNNLPSEGSSGPSVAKGGITVRPSGRTTSNLRRSLSMTNLPLTKTKANDDKSSEDADLYILTVQKLAEMELGKIAQEKTRAQIEKKIQSQKEEIKDYKLKKSLLEKRIKEIHFIKKTDEALNEIEAIGNDLDKKLKRFNPKEIENLIQHLKTAQNQLAIENIVLPRNESEVELVQYHLKQATQTLADYEQLKSNVGVDVNGLANFMAELVKATAEMESAKNRCLGLKELINDRALEDNAKKVMLKKKRNRRR